VTWRSPDTYQPAGIERGTATSRSTTTGTTSEGMARGVTFGEVSFREILTVDLR
jgi:hypothetical protein